MTLKIAYATPASAVAQNGTITLSYPTDTTAGDYATHGHRMFSEGLQAYFSQDAGTMSVSFGASDITVTYRGSTSIPANSRVSVELNVRGLGELAPPSLIGANRTSYANIVRLELGAPDTADADGIVESQSLTSAGVYSTLAFNGVYGDPYGNAYAVLDVPRNVVAAWTTTAVMTVTGLDEYGDVVVESSGSGTSFTGKKAFKRITSIAVSANVTSMTVGTGDVLGLPAFVAFASQVKSEMQDNVEVGDGARVVRMAIDIADLTAEADYFLALPGAGQILKLTSTIDAAVSTADITITPLIVGGSAMTGGVITITQSGSAAGDLDTATPTANNTYTAGGVLKLTVTGGGAGGTPRGHVYIDIALTSLASGATFVAGVQTTPTATTGDVRGTYDPAVACDGSRQFALLVALPEPNYRGVDNFDG